MTDPITRIEAALGRLGEDHEPPVGWEARVLAAANASAHTEPAQRSAHRSVLRSALRRWWWFAAPAIALAGVIIVIVGRPPEAQPLQVAFTVDKSGTVVRGSEPQLGDVVHAITTGGGPHRAVWVYRNDALVMSCPGPVQCRSSDDSIIADVTVRSLGKYKIVALTSKSPVPAPAGKFDVDIANALRAGATMKDLPFTVN